MRIVITGGTGFIGKSLSLMLAQAGYQVIVLTRSTSPSNIAGVKNVVWDAETCTGWHEYADGADAIINLAGHGIANGRWSPKVKGLILNSRINAGKAVCQAVAKAKIKPKAVIQGSAIGYYGSTGDKLLSETSLAGDSYLSRVAKKWEDSTLPVENEGVRRVIIRTGMVLGCGGVLEKMVQPFKMGFGSYLGSGQQGVSWIHIDDEVKAIKYLIYCEKCFGAYNLTSIQPITFNKFANSLASVFGKKVHLRVPSFILKTLVGEMAQEVLLAGNLVLPDRLIADGFKFDYVDIKQALKSVTCLQD